MTTIPPFPSLSCDRRGLLRRSLLQRGLLGLLSLNGLGALHAGDPLGAADLSPRPPHFPARAKRVIFLFMRGGPSHMDTFDYKPLLQRDGGKPLPYALPKLQVALKRNLGKLMPSPFTFARHGQSGLWISELFPHLAKHADRLCMLNGMHTEGVDHGQAIIRLHTGTDTQVRPSMGSWIVHGLGSENPNLPGFVTISPLRGEVGTRGYSSAFLPAINQGTPIGRDHIPAEKATIRHLGNPDLAPAEQRRQLDLLQAMNRDQQARTGADARLQGVSDAFELAFRMQAEAPGVLDLSRETAATREIYGIGKEPTDDFGRQCLLARRFAEAGVRYIQVTHAGPDDEAVPGWDQHKNLKPDLTRNCREVDQPIAALLTDLAARGLLKDTLVVWGGEFGRTPVTEGRDGSFGRDHNPYGFTMWLAGGGVRAGLAHGATDDYGYHATEGKVHMHDLHATILHLLGLDHERLTYRYAGRDFRLTDVYGTVVKEIVA